MRPFRVAALLAGVALTAGIAANQVLPAKALAAEPAFTLVGPGRPAREVGADELAALPQQRQRVTFQTGHGAQTAEFGGVPLWSLIMPALPAGAPKSHVRFAVYVTGRDGYTASVAEGEIDPAFEGKPVLLGHALDVSGAARGPLRLVVPGDRHGARYVEDVARIEIR
jgi:hypothetical protein